MRYLGVIAALLVLMGLSSCGSNGKDGPDGTSYAAVDWYYGLVAYSFPGFPTSWSSDTYYQMSGGDYTWEYELYSSSYGYGTWYFDLTISVNAGEKGQPGGLFVNGKDGAAGADLYFHVWLDWANVYIYKYNSAQSFAENMQAAKNGAQNIVKNSNGGYTEIISNQTYTVKLDFKGPGSSLSNSTNFILDKNVH